VVLVVNLALVVPHLFAKPPLPFEKYPYFF
jgi:hypothetical protein